MTAVPPLGQLPLFDTEPLAPAARSASLESIVWSYSRRSTLEQCALRYYFQYFGAGKRSGKVESTQEELRLLKSLSNRHERVGSILHLAIAWYLREAQRGKTHTVERLQGWARWLFEEDRVYSRQYPDGGGLEASGKFPPALLREYHYRLANAEELCDQAEARLLTALESFATDSRYSGFREAGSAPGALVERPFKVRPEGLLCRIDGKIDLAFGHTASATVVDWKLGEGDGTGDDSLQLAVYALWAAEHFGCDPRSMRVCKVHLGSGEVVDFRADAAVLAAARARITQDAQLMAAIQPYGQAGISEAFTACGQRAVCNSCPFQQRCPEGKQYIDA